MRIAITGVPSTGKTSLSRAVAEHLGVTYMEEQPLLDAAFKYCDDNNLPLTTRYLPNFTTEDVMHWQRGFLKAKYEFDKTHTEYVADGCPLLTITYVLTTCHGTFTKEEVDEAYNNLLAMAKSYDVIYQLPFGVLPIVDDGRRTTSHNFHRMQDLVLRGLFDLHSEEINAFEIPSTDFEERFNLVVSDITQRKAYGKWLIDICKLEK